MSGDGSFLARWSRRKYFARRDASEPSKQEDPPDPVACQMPAGSVSPGDTRSPFEAASLPTIESIDAESNIQAFLDAKVPPDLTHAALRRAWSVDPAIRDFVGLSENSWDFNAPGAMPGFGPISKEEAGRLLTQLLGEPEPSTATVHKAPATPLISPSEDYSEKSTTESDQGEHQATTSQSVVQASAPDQELDLERVNNDDGRTSYRRAVTSQPEPASREDLSTISRRGHGSALPQP